jgi:hypothetical protein
VKHFQGIFINDIIQNFNGIGVAVKTDEQVFTANVAASVTLVQLFIVQIIVKSPTYVRFGYFVLER